MNQNSKKCQEDTDSHDGASLTQERVTAQVNSCYLLFSQLFSAASVRKNESTGTIDAGV